MSGIHVLSDILKGGNKLEKTSTPKGKDVSGSPENAAAVFAAMLSGSMNPNADPKGLNSKAGQESEEKQSAGNPVQSVQNPNGQGSMLGCGNFALTNLFQPMLQSDLPAGKEANSGNNVSQGTGGLATANASLTNAPIVLGNNLELAMLNLVSLASDEVSAQLGMTTQKPPGDNPGIAELDKYRQVIADLLVALSGEITNTSLKGTSLSSESSGTKDLSQEMAKIVQGWMTATDEVSKGGQDTSGRVTESVDLLKALQEEGSTMANSSSNKAFDSLAALSGDSAAPSPKGTPISSKGIQPLLDVLLTKGFGSGNPVLYAKAATLLAALNPILSQEVKDAKTPQGVNGTLDAEGGIIDPATKGSSESFMKPLNGTDLDLVATQVKDTAILTNVPQKSDGMVPQENKTLKIFQGTFKEEFQKRDSTQSTEISGVKDVNNQNLSSGIGVVRNIVAVNATDEKTVAIPVLEQISTVVREQVMNRHQALKELDIQLHPADLGKIQIAMRWENGQVHLQVQASEAATGQLLQKQLSELRLTLTNQGVNCGMLEMGQGRERQQNPHGNESQRTFNPSTHPNEDEDLIPVTNPLSLGRDEINRINVTA